MLGLSDTDVAGGERVDHGGQVIDQGCQLQAGSDLAVGEVGVGSEPAGHRAVAVVEEQLAALGLGNDRSEFGLDSAGVQLQLSEALGHRGVVQPGELFAKVVDTGGDHDGTLSYVCAKNNEKKNK